MKRELVCALLTVALMALPASAQDRGETKTEDLSDTIYKLFKQNKVKKRPARTPGRTQAPAAPQQAPTGPQTQQVGAIGPGGSVINADLTPDPTKITIVKTGGLEVRSPGNSHRFAASALGEKVVVAWSGWSNDQRYAEGLYALYDSMLRPISNPRVYTPVRQYSNSWQASYIVENRVAVLSGGNILFVYNLFHPGSRIHQGYFSILSETGQPVKSPTIFCQNDVKDIALTRLKGGKAVFIAYYDQFGASGEGKCLVVNHDGRIVAGPVVFNDRGRTENITATTLSNGLVLITYDCGFAYSMVVDPFCNIIKERNKLHTNRPLGPRSATLLDDGKVFVATTFDSGTAYVLSSSGGVAAKKRFYTKDINTDPFAATFSDGNVLVTFLTKETASGRLAPIAMVLDPSGNIVKQPRRLIPERFYALPYMLGRAKLPEDRVFVTFKPIPHPPPMENPPSFMWLMVR